MPSIEKIVIDGILPSLNEYVNRERSNRYSAAGLKHKYTTLCSVYTRAGMNAGIHFNWPCRLKFTWYLKDKRKDPDNVAFAKKFILDGFQQCGFLDNDNLKHITGFVDEFYIDKEHPRVEIEALGGQP
ncbi:endodeoxyribonuclease [Levilactobacillus acidifarinae]|nr:endodeoxyribonuclease [Levilactobacillus acidifarinae]